jgi:hypothetical protein
MKSRLHLIVDETTYASQFDPHMDPLWIPYGPPMDPYSPPTLITLITLVTFT